MKLLFAIWACALVTLAAGLVTRNGGLAFFAGLALAWYINLHGDVKRGDDWGLYHKTLRGRHWVRH